MQEGEMDTVMTIKEVSEYLRLAESTIYKLAKEGELPGRKVGGAWRFSKMRLDAWLQEAPEESEKLISPGIPQPANK
jgi:excisionase family DNA binding protein